MKARNENLSRRLQNPPPAAATAIAQRKLAERTQQAFLALGARLSATRSSQEAARAIYAAADSLWKWDAGAVALWLPDSGHVETVLACDLVDGQRRELVPGLAAGPAAAGIRRIMDAGAELTLRKPGDSPGCDFVPFGNAARRPASIMCAPMRAESKTVGVLSIQSYTQNVFTQEHLRTLQVLADYCAGAFDRLLAEEAVRQREEMNRTILATAMDGYYALDFAADPRGAIVDVNEAFCRLTGYSSEELLQMRITDLEAAESPEDVVRHSQKIIQARGDRFETRHRRRDGREIHIEICTSHVLGSQGRIFGFVRDIGERKRAEAALREADSALRASEERYRALAESSPDAIFILDRDIRVQYFNVTAAALWRRSPQEMIGLMQSELFPAEVAQDQSRVVRSVFETGNLICREKPLAFPVGDRWIEIRLAPLRDAQGAVTAVMGVCRDITERKRAEAILRQTTDRLSLAARAGGVGIWDYDVVNNRLVWDDQMFRLYGITRDQFSGAYQAWQAGLHPEDRQRGDEEIRLALRGEKDFNTEFRVVWPDGSQHSIRALALVQRDSSGQPVQMIGTNWDITAQKRTEAALLVDITDRKRAAAEINRQAGLISSLLDSIPDIVFFKDVNGVYLGCNPSFAQFAGRSRDEIVGRTDYHLFDKKIADFFREHDQRILESCQARHNEEWITYPDGRKMLIDTLKTPYLGPDGALIGVLGISRDITERKRVEQQLAEALDLNQKMIASSTMGIAAYKASGECVFANETLARMVGGSLSEVHGGDFRRLEFWKESGLVHIADQALSLGQACSIEIFGTTRFGKTLAADCHVTPFVSHGQPHLLFGLLDISERKRADALLRAQRDVGVGLSLTSDIRVALKIFLEVAVEVAGLDCGGLYRIIPATQDMELAAHYGLSDLFVKAVTHYSAGDPETKLVLQGQSVFTAFRNLPAAQSAAGLHEGLRAVAVIPLSHNRRVIGVLNLASHTAEDIPMQARIVIEAMATQAAGAIARINAENESHRLERQLLGITDREHARMGQDIHDGLCQQLVSLALDANSLLDQLAAARRPEAAKARRIADYLDRSITEARQLSRGLFPVRLEREGLPPALEELAAATRDRFNIRCRFTSAGPVAVESSVTATHLYRIAQEAVTNAVKHSGAGSIAIRLRARAGALELSVTDNGAGLSAARRREATGMGLQIMDYRARTIGGTIEFGPGPRGGTRVFCCVPAPVSGVSGA